MENRSIMRYILCIVILHLTNRGRAQHCPPDEGWEKHGDKCYWNSEQLMMRVEAKAACEAMGMDSHLIVVDNQDAQNYLEGKNFDYDVWIGLTVIEDLHLNEHWHWSDGTESDWFQWRQAPTSTPCVQMVKEGHWSAFACAIPLPYTCKKPKNGGSCESGWLEWNGNSHCYYYSTIPRTNMAAALDCLNRNAHLASIHSAEENEFAQALITEEQGSWIGLFAIIWEDGATYNWHKFAPFGGPAVNFPCVIFTTENIWVQAPCGSDLYHYTCQTDADHTTLPFVETTVAPTTITTTTEEPKTTTEKPFCQTPSWEEYDNNCYLFSEELLTRIDAETACEEMNSHLVTVDTPDVHTFLTLKNLGYEFWIGLAVIQRLNLAENWHWSDGTPSTWVQWSTPPTRSACVELRMNGTWEAFACYLPRQYFCKKDKTAASCEVGWVERTGHDVCYYHSAVKMTNMDAVNDCFSREANLASIHSVEENEFMQGLITDKDDGSWIGLYSLIWDDGTVYNYHQFASNGGPQLSKPCVKYTSGSINIWTDSACDTEQLHYICQTGDESVLKNSSRLQANKPKH